MLALHCNEISTMMHEDGQKLLRLMFRPDERICVSHNKYGYHSLELDYVLKYDEITLVPTFESCEKRNIPWTVENFDRVYTKDLKLVALNPIKDWRQDYNCTAFRNFLIEMDFGALDKQLEYIKQIKMPYSAVVFSGNKSLHFLISLDEDLPSENIYRFFSEWILNIATMADQLTKNPSRSIRIPGAERDGKFQKLVEYKGKVSLKQLVAWLSNYPACKPVTKKKKERPDGTKTIKVEDLPNWLAYKLVNGVDRSRGRNAEWFSIARKMALLGYSEDDTIELLENYFDEERDFKEKEWLSAIKSAFKHVYR